MLTKDKIPFINENSNMDKALKIIRGLTELNIIGFDLVEVSPQYDHAEITALAGATIILEYLYLLGNKRKTI